jgi:hypothetical protein
MLGMLDASRFITMNEGEGRREDWWMRRCVRLESVSLAMTTPEGIEDEFTPSSACSASRSCAVYSCALVICSRDRRLWVSHLGTWCGTHVDYLLNASLNPLGHGEGEYLPYGEVLLGGIKVEAC